jgi:hypothetical protein
MCPLLAAWSWEHPYEGEFHAGDVDGAAAGHDLAVGLEGDGLAVRTGTPWAGTPWHRAALARVEAIS